MYKDLLTILMLERIILWQYFSRISSMGHGKHEVWFKSSEQIYCYLYMIANSIAITIQSS